MYDRIFKNHVLVTLQSLAHVSKHATKLKNTEDGVKCDEPSVFSPVSRWFAGDDRMSNLKSVHKAWSTIDELLLLFERHVLVSTHWDHYHQSQVKEIKSIQEVLKDLSSYETSVSEGLENLTSVSSYSSDMEYKNGVSELRKSWTKFMERVLSLLSTCTYNLENVPVSDMFQCQKHILPESEKQAKKKVLQKVEKKVDD